MECLEELKRAVTDWNKNPVENVWSFKAFKKNVIGKLFSEEAFKPLL